MLVFFSNLLLFLSKTLKKIKQIKINQRLNQLNQIPPKTHQIRGSDLCELANSLLLWRKTGLDGREDGRFDGPICVVYAMV